MKVIGRPQIGEWIRLHPEAASALQAWLCEADAAAWSSVRDVGSRYRAARITPDGAVVFPLCAGRFALETRVHFTAQAVLVVKLAVCQSDQFALQLETDDKTANRRSALLSGGGYEH